MPSEIRYAIPESASLISCEAAEQCLEAFGNHNDRPVLTHCQILGEDLIKKMVSQGVVANIQPSFVPTDSMWVEKRLCLFQFASVFMMCLRLSDLQYGYAWKTLIQNGVVCAGGSDAPIETHEPLVGMYDAIFRQICSRMCTPLTSTGGINLVIRGGQKNAYPLRKQ